MWPAQRRQFCASESAEVRSWKGVRLSCSMAGPLVRCPGVQRSNLVLSKIVLAADRVQGPHGGNLLQGAGERGLFLGVCGDHHMRADAAALVVGRQTHRVAA